MKKPLQDVIFCSRKRRDILILLQEAPLEMDYLLKSLDTNRQALLPQVKILENHYLVTKSDDVYGLTTIGKLIVDEVKPLLDTINVFDTNVEYWGTHDLGFIPPYLLKRIHELSSCKVISNIPLTQIYEPSENVLEKAKFSKVQTSVTTFIFPNFASILKDFTESGVKMRLIVTQELLSKIRNEMEEIRSLLNSGDHEVFLYSKEMNFMSFGTNDFCFMMRALTKKGDYDMKYIMTCKPSAIQWGHELFDCYLKDSTPITVI
ncbi:winged helix-turn-helix domain-containing protein [Methanolobus sp.]|uniref:helix-turn-helix transcriptional regulator n=1 Tax=Methanolobus sp. TaxID=1874737 RepID=UPI0025F164B6|nr:winged helix-turn-helix domain-containing protein [Methanolobus sp.]